MATNREVAIRERAKGYLPDDVVVDVLVGRAGSSPQRRLVRNAIIVAVILAITAGLIVVGRLHPAFVVTGMVVAFVFAYPAFLATFDPMWFIVVTKKDLALVRFKARDNSVVGRYPRPLRALPPTRARWVRFEVGPELIWVRRVEHGSTIDKYTVRNR